MQALAHTRSTGSIYHHGLHSVLVLWATALRGIYESTSLTFLFFFGKNSYTHQNHLRTTNMSKKNSSIELIHM